jgi:hypothetical protein
MIIVGRPMISRRVSAPRVKSSLVVGQRGHRNRRVRYRDAVSGVSRSSSAAYTGTPADPSVRAAARAPWWLAKRLALRSSAAQFASRAGGVVMAIGSTVTS